MITQRFGNGVGPFPGKPQTHYTVFAPLTQNDGRPQPPERLAWLEGELVNRAGGLTRYSPGHGLWVPPLSTVLCRDEVVPFHVVTANGPETERWLVTLMAEIARVFEQADVFVFAQPVWLLDTVPLATLGRVPEALSFRT